MTKLAMFAAAALLAAAPAGAVNPDDDEQGSGYLGVRLQRIDGGLAEALNLKADSGVLLGQVLQDSPAAKAGLKSGDIVTRIGDTAVGTPDALRTAIDGRKPGEVVSIEYLRDGKPHTARATLGEAESRTPGDLPRIGRLHDHLRAVRDLRLGREHGWLGVYTQPLSGDLGEYFGVKEGGALVSEVVAESPAAKLGLKPGDVIVRIDDEKIADPDDLRSIVAKHDEPADIQIAWVRNHRPQQGKTKLEVREGMAMLEPFDEAVAPDALWTPEQGERFRQRVHAFHMRAEDETEHAVQELKEQVEKLQAQVKKLERKSR
jgi:S1-C subfamily serine protease